MICYPPEETSISLLIINSKNALNVACCQSGWLPLQLSLCQYLHASGMCDLPIHANGVLVSISTILYLIVILVIHVITG